MVALVNRMTFVGQFGQKWAKGSGCRGWVTKLFAEIQVEPDLFVIRRSKGLGDVRAVEPALEAGHPLWGQLHFR